MKTIVYDMLGELEPAVMQRLESMELYQLFMAKRSKLKIAASDEFKISGSLANDDINVLRREVETLEAQVLCEIENIRFMLSKPSFEAFQAMLNRTTSR